MAALVVSDNFMNMVIYKRGQKNVKIIQKIGHWLKGYAIDEYERIL